MRRSLCCLFSFAATMLTVSATADGLKQVNPIKAAPPVINNNSLNFHNEYPWFSSDGKLFLWTRQDNSGDGLQWIWVTYLKNRAQIVGKKDGDPLPGLQVATPVNLSVVNQYFVANEPGAEIKALAVCEEPSPSQPTDLGSRWRYRFTLYLAVGPPGQSRKMWRAHRVFVSVWKSSGEIDSYGMSGGFEEVIPPAPHAVNPSITANETEPMLSPDSQYLFWASNAWGGQNNVAHYIGPEGAGECYQRSSTPVPYDYLPSNKYAWKDQYSSGFLHEQTSRTNYHTMIARSDGKTAIIFEECQGKRHCDPLQAGNRDCLCEQTQNNSLSTTGFTSGGEPTPIVNHTSGKLNTWRRVTHPAVSGPQNSDGSWLLFFMRDRKIYYTKIKPS